VFSHSEVTITGSFYPWSRMIPKDALPVTAMIPLNKAFRGTGLFRRNFSISSRM
jgi:hypothetical protein